jgi:hypothetical protein
MKLQWKLSVKIQKVCVCYLYAEVNYGLYENVIDAMQIQTM